MTGAAQSRLASGAILCAGQDLEDAVGYGLGEAVMDGLRGCV